VRPPEENSEDENKSKKEKPRSSRLPPVDILFAHLDRVDSMKTKV